jgi:hypothetical protein
MKRRTRKVSLLLAGDCSSQRSKFLNGRRTSFHIDERSLSIGSWLTVMRPRSGRFKSNVT